MSICPQDVEDASKSELRDIKNTCEDEYELKVKDAKTITVKLTIEGEGKVEAKENDCYAIFVDNGGEVTINGGTIIGNIHAVYVSNNGGVANLNGGYYDIKQKYNATVPYRMLLNCGDTGYKNGISKIIVKGGEYVGFDPANNDAEGANTNFVAAGYKSEANGNNYVVVLE